MACTTIILLSILTALLALVALYKTRTRTRTSKKYPPGPLPLPLIGTAYLMRNDQSPFVQFTKFAEKYGPVYSMKMGSTTCTVVSDLETIRSVLMQNGKFFGGRPDFIRYHKLFADDRQNSLALSDWCSLQVRRRNVARRHCNPRQHSPLNKVIGEAGRMEMRELISTLKNKQAEAPAGHFKLKPVIMNTCLNLFANYMCSTRFDLDDPEFQHVTKLFDEIFWEINQGYAVDFFPALLPFYKNHMDKLTEWSQEIRNFILTRIVNMREVNLDDSEEEKDFTDALLKILKYEKGEFTRDAILFTLEDFLGGSSAVGNLVMVMLALIVKHPEVGKKIQKEIDDLTGGMRMVDVSDCESLPFTMASLKETLRYSSSPIVPHVATEDAKVGEYDVHKGNVIIINNYQLNMDKKLWDEPEKFNPERFVNRTYVEVKQSRRGSDHDSGMESDNENDVAKKNTIEDEKMMKKEVVTLKNNLSHFMPFSIGKRTCLGRGLLMNYALVTAATVLQHFDISSPNPEEIKTYTACVALPPDTFSLTLTPRGT